MWGFVCKWNHISCTWCTPKKSLLLGSFPQNEVSLQKQMQPPRLLLILVTEKNIFCSINCWWCKSEGGQFLPVSASGFKNLWYATIAPSISYSSSCWTQSKLSRILLMWSMWATSLWNATTRCPFGAAETLWSCSSRMLIASSVEPPSSEPPKISTPSMKIRRLFWGVSNKARRALWMPSVLPENRSNGEYLLKLLICTHPWKQP